MGTDRETDPGTDTQQAVADATPLARDLGKDVVVYIREAEVTVEAVLRHQWESVDRLAVSLLRRRSMRMTFAQVVRLIGRLDWPEGLAG